ncbi:hypothetical protein A9Q83_17000 [Alphaproteobacteria bacterium 46_93_T64]|nr:hypothetical protein A9Q83_17000 [Alphaproteobacteria bacterium 46_93_T64]
MKSLRILPVTVIAMILVFGLKLGSFWSDAQGVLFDLDVSVVEAEEKTEKNETTPEKMDEAAKEGEDTSEARAFDASELSESEIEVLQKLSVRREQLVSREKSLDLRDKLLEATEKRIDGKIAKLKQIEATIQDLLKEYDDQELRKLKSLVTIYEKMKAKDAARIFNSLDMKVLLDLTGLMKESKLAAILGKMDGARAKELTIELATRKQLPDIDKKKG